MPFGFSAEGGVWFNSEASSVVVCSAGASALRPPSVRLMPPVFFASGGGVLGARGGASDSVSEAVDAGAGALRLPNVRLMPFCFSLTPI